MDRSEKIVRKYDKKVLKIQIKKHKKLGKYYKYPFCCIEQFCREAYLGINSSGKRQEQFGKEKIKNMNKEYVPCDKCIIESYNANRSLQRYRKEKEGK